MLDISVAIHSYNRRDYIVETVESVLNQTLKPKEVIVIDDGSSDDTEAVLAPFKGQIYYEKIANVGCGTSRKVSVEKCASNWIACNDDDDIWAPDHLETLAKVVTQYPECGYVFSNHTHFGPRAEADYNHFASAPAGWWQKAIARQEKDSICFRDDAFIHFLSFNPSFPSAWMFSRDAYEKAGGIDPKYSRMNSEDSDLTRRLLLSTTAACSEKVTVKLRRHNANMSDNYAANLSCKALIISDIIEKGLVPDAYLKHANETIQQARTEAFRQYYWAGDYQKAKQLASEGVASLTLKDKLRLMRANFKDKA